MADVSNIERRTINILLSAPLAGSSEPEAQVIAQCISEIQRVDGHFARLNFLGGARAQSNTTLREDFERDTGAPFTPQDYRGFRLSLLRNADAFIIIRTGMSESTAFEIARNLFGDNPIPMFFAIWHRAPSEFTPVRDLHDLGDVTYVEFGKPSDLRRPLWTFLNRVCGLDDESDRIPPAGHLQVERGLAPSVAKEGKRRAPRHTGVLVLADGQVFRGQGIGAERQVNGEICFNTAMTGYQEILSDPSHAGRIVTFSFPHIGNTGANREDMETALPLALGCVLRDPITPASSHRATGSLTDWLSEHEMTGIADVDTREITRMLREDGTRNCVIAHDRDGEFDIDAMVAEAARAPGLVGHDLAFGEIVHGGIEVTGAEIPGVSRNSRVVVVDYGVKESVVDCLARRGLDVTVVPAGASSNDIMAHEPDGIVLSNGPGEPLAVAPYLVPLVERLLAEGLPTFGICFGHQLLALALGARVKRMYFGHRGTNHPVLDKSDGRVVITSQNHGLAVDRDTLPTDAVVTHVSLLDGTLAGFEIAGRNVLSVQFHPEASPGPHDAEPLFDRFADRVRDRSAQRRTATVHPSS